MSTETAAVIVNPTIMDGTVVRWRRDPEGNDVVSASRNAVIAAADAPQEWVEAAEGAHAELKRNNRVDLKHLATHRSRGLFGPNEPIAAVTS